MVVNVSKDESKIQALCGYYQQIGFKTISKMFDWSKIWTFYYDFYGPNLSPLSF